MVNRKVTVIKAGPPEPQPEVKQAVPDQTAKADAGKRRLTLVPRRIIDAIALIREYGVKKYTDPDNWKRVEVERYRDAAFRHFMAYLDDPDSMDEESGLFHLWHLACNIAFLIDLEWKRHWRIYRDGKEGEGKNSAN